MDEYVDYIESLFTELRAEYEAKIQELEAELETCRSIAIRNQSQ